LILLDKKNNRRGRQGGDKNAKLMILCDLCAFFASFAVSKEIIEYQKLNMILYLILILAIIYK